MVAGGIGTAEAEEEESKRHGARREYSTTVREIRVAAIVLIMSRHCYVHASEETQ